MTPRHARRQPNIHSPGTRQLAEHVRVLSRRRPGFDRTVAAIRDGDDQVLHALVVDAQGGDPDAAVTALWALLPRLCAVVISRRPVSEWSASIDDYLSLAFLTIRDVDVAAPVAFLGDKIIARTRRRHERAGERDAKLPCAQLEAPLAADDDVERHVLARLELDALAHAVRGGLVSEASWRNVVSLGFERQCGAVATDRERSLLKRARRRLEAWRAEAA